MILNNVADVILRTIANIEMQKVKYR